MYSPRGLFVGARVHVEQNKEGPHVVLTNHEAVLLTETI